MGAAMAQAPDTAQIEKLIATLEDPGEREAFLDDLRALVEANRGAGADSGDVTGNRLAGIVHTLGGIDDRFIDLIDRFANAGEIAHWISEQAARGDLWTAVAWQAGLTLLFGALAWIAAGALVARRVRGLRDREVVTWLERPLVVGEWFCLGVAPVAAFAVTGFVAMALIAPEEHAHMVASAAIHAVALFGAAAVAVRVLLAPLLPHIRILPVGDRDAAYLVVWFNRLASTGVFGFLAADLLRSLGAPAASATFLSWLVGLTLTAMTVVIVLQNRSGIASRIRGEGGTGGGVLRRRLADIWHVAGVVAAVVLFLVWSLDVESGFWLLLRGFGVTALALVGGILASALVSRGVGRLFRIGDDLRRQFPGLEKRGNRYVFLVGWLLNAVIWLGALVVVLESWGVPAAGFILSSGGLDTLGRLVSITIVAVGAVVVWELGDGVVAGYLKRSEDGTLSPRLATLLPLFRNALMVVVGSIAVFMILGELGLDITPLLAGAGVIGLAIGFGAQALVRDVITGTFILFENQFSVGDWIDVGGKMGGVESMTIRTVTLRDLDGYVHTVPFGEISMVTNMMRDYGYAVIDIGIAYQENTDRVLGVLREVDAEARKDPELAARLTGELETLGVNALGDSAVTLRVRIRTLAGYQWGVRRDYLRLIKLRFDEEGIEIPFPHMTVYFGEMRGGRTSPAIVRLDAQDRLPDRREARPAPARETSHRGRPKPEPPDGEGA